MKKLFILFLVTVLCSCVSTTYVDDSNTNLLEYEYFTFKDSVYIFAGHYNRMVAKHHHYKLVYDYESTEYEKVLNKTLWHSRNPVLLEILQSRPTDESLPYIDTTDLESPWFLTIPIWKNSFFEYISYVPEYTYVEFNGNLFMYPEKNDFEPGNSRFHPLYYSDNLIFWTEINNKMPWQPDFQTDKEHFFVFDNTLYRYSDSIPGSPVYSSNDGINWDIELQLQNNHQVQHHDSARHKAED